MSRSPTVPAWITDPDLIASIEAGLVDIPDDFAAGAEHKETESQPKAGDFL
ncbi:hypothetical protein [Streptomyces sediminimaris]|uniref:hypothetical protein n=1 Tax=Streptomyces sediminimaris TaxID=3383721 RepID=UPI003999BE61